MNGESRLLKKLLRGLPESDDLVVGPGDDCAVVRMGRGHQLLKTDCLAEGVHFVREEDPSRVGWKALCRPLSDIAAMGGTPGMALVTLFSPPDLDEKYWVEFYRGLGKAARKFGVVIAGGELSRQPQGIAVSVALTGSVPGRRFVRRGGGSPGDRLFVTGCLGGSIAGHHLDFLPRLQEGRWLAQRGRATAMMDVSDGLGSDLPRLAQASGCGFAVERNHLPVRKGATPEQALTDGEDYELLFAVPDNRADRLVAAWPFRRTLLTEIGRLCDPGDVPRDWPSGWDHFSIASGTPRSQPAANAGGRARHPK